MADRDQPSAQTGPPPPVRARQKLVAVVGPTGVGKSAIAVELADRLGGEIISADSRYLYRGLDIGTDKPSPAARARVRHHLIDVADPGTPWSLAEYTEAASGLVADINQRRKLPLLVGGTGQYIQAILQGWNIPRRKADPELRAALQARAEREGVESLFRQLVDVDPVAAGRIDRRNLRRVIRALEVSLTTGRPFSAQRGRAPPPYRSVVIGLNLPRPRLYARIDERIEAMFARGLVEEVRALAARGYDWTLPALSAIGYKQVGMYLRGECDLAEARRLVRRATRRLVRQQANWFRADDPQIRWYDAENTDLRQLAEDVFGLQSAL